MGMCWGCLVGGLTAWLEKGKWEKKWKKFSRRSTVVLVLEGRVGSRVRSELKAKLFPLIISDSSPGISCKTCRGCRMPSICRKKMTMTTKV